EAFDEGLEFAVHREIRRTVVARSADIVAPGGRALASFFGGHGFLVCDVVHFPAEGVQGGHGVALFARQENEGERQVGGTFLGDRAALLHGLGLQAGRRLVIRAARRQSTGVGKRGVARAVLTALALASAAVFAAAQGAASIHIFARFR